MILNTIYQNGCQNNAPSRLNHDRASYHQGRRNVSKLCEDVIQNRLTWSNLVRFTIFFPESLWKNGKSSKLCDDVSLRLPIFRRPCPQHAQMDSIKRSLPKQESIKSLILNLKVPNNHKWKFPHAGNFFQQISVVPSRDRTGDLWIKSLSLY